jgi:hypothetical protein
MFGLTDNKNLGQTLTDSQPLPGSGGIGLVTDSTGFGISSPPLPQQPGISASLPIIPPQPHVNNSSAETSTPAVPSAPPIQDHSLPPPAASLHSVNLSNAYIATESANPTKSDADQKPTAASLVSSPHEDELLKIKQQALQSLAPMVDKLEQSPEEKFKTTMMLIQASDNAGLIKDAYDAAHQITDEKARAQALLDVVNEINYFTHHQSALPEANKSTICHI